MSNSAINVPSSGPVGPIAGVDKQVVFNDGGSPAGNAGLTFDKATGILASAFSGPVTGNVTGNVSGSSGSCTGLAASATVLVTPRAINGVNFDGSAPITVTAAAGTLTGTALNATVVSSSLTSVGTLAALTVTAAPTFRALTSGYLPKAGTAGLMGNSPIYTDGTGIGIGMTTGLLATLNIATGVDAAIGLIVKANSTTQSAHLTDWRSSANAAIAFVSGNGTNGTSGLISTIANTPADPSGTAISAGANFGFNASVNNFFGMGLGAARNSKYDLWFQTGAANGGGYRFYIGATEKVTIDYLGNVGIMCQPDTRLDIDAGAMEFAEMTAPAAGAANTARLFCQDNGAGKTQLMCIFASGVAQQVALEP